MFRVKSQRVVRPSQTQVAMTAGAMISLQPNEKGAVLRRGQGASCRKTSPAPTWPWPAVYLWPQDSLLQ